jgi:hypothetical protein
MVTEPGEGRDPIGFRSQYIWVAVMVVATVVLAIFAVFPRNGNEQTDGASGPESKSGVPSPTPTPREGTD